MFALAGVLALTAMRCHDPSGAAAELPFTLHHARWESEGIRDYHFAFQRLCFCRGPAIAPVRIRVARGEVIDVRDTLDRPVDSAVVAQHFAITIDSLFGVIAEALRSGRQLEARYDLALGYPTHIAVDRDQRQRDGGLAFTAQLLRPLPR